MINNVNNNQFPDINAQSRIAQNKGGNTKTGNNADVLSQIGDNPLIKKAMQKPDEQVNAVENARKLLADGKLDTPENILKAARNIVEFGI